MLQFHHDPYELHHCGLYLQREHFAMLEETPPFVMVPYELPDPYIWVMEGGREPLGRDGPMSCLVLPTVMETICELQVKELADDYDTDYGEHWNNFASLYGSAFDPVYHYFGIDDGDWGDESPWRPIRIHSCWPVTSEQANVIVGTLYDQFEGGPWPILERYAQLCEHYGTVDSVLELAARSIPAGLPDRERQALEEQAEQYMSEALEFEELERMIYTADNEVKINDNNFAVTLPEDLDAMWKLLLHARQRAMSALPQLIESSSATTTERLFYSWP